MQHQFKPGDLALIIASNEPQDIGRVCEIIDHPFIDNQEEYLVRGEVHEGDNDGILSVFADMGSVGGPDFGGIWMFAVAQLMPLRDDHAPQSEQQKELAHGQA